ncbi:MAG: metallopeptidase TldD-related protein [Bryobacteraceae bacterium]
MSCPSAIQAASPWKRTRYVARLAGAVLLLAAASQGATIDPAVAKAVQDDPQLRAMSDELARSQTLRLNDLPRPYFISFSSDDVDLFTASASLGGILSSGDGRVRVASIQVRLGDYKFDNMNCSFSGQLRSVPLPLEDDYTALRTTLWLAADQIYKRSTEELAAKKNIVREAQNPDSTPDFTAEPGLQLVLPVPVAAVDDKAWVERVKSLSGRFASHNAIVQSNVTVKSIVSTFRLTNTEGSIIRTPELFAGLEIKARAVADDGNQVWDTLFLNALKVADLPNEAKLAALVDQVATETETIRTAPLATDYSGPVLFENQAAAAMLAEVLADALHADRKPVAPQGQPPQLLEGVWATRIGSKVLPDWASLLDDPKERQFDGKPLLGAYEVDVEGVAAKPVHLVDNGTLKYFYVTRTPVRTFTGSDGHGRMHGPFGEAYPLFGNLFFQAAVTVPNDQMKAKLIDMVKANGLKYGMLMRRMDFPSTASRQDLEEILKQAAAGGNSRTISPPILAYRVYPDGREELVRGVRFKDFSAKDLRNIVAASDAPYVLNYVNNGARFAWADAGSEASMSSVVAPALLLESVDLGRSQDDLTKPPIVPAPPLVAPTAAK